MLVGLDPYKTWVSSMTGFGNCARAYYNNSIDWNTGTIVFPDDGHDTGMLSIDASTDMTIEFWMYPYDSGGGWGSRIIKKYTGGNYNITYQNGQLTYSWSFLRCNIFRRATPCANDRVGAGNQSGPDPISMSREGRTGLFSLCAIRAGVEFAFFDLPTSKLSTKLGVKIF